MVKAVYRPGECSLTISGHAGYAEPGSDIVCAGVSALAGAVWATLRDYPGFTYHDDGEGLCFRFDTAFGNYGCTVISTAANGIGLIAGQYPDHVQFFTEQGG